MINIRIKSPIKFDIDKCPVCNGTLTEHGKDEKARGRIERVHGRCEACKEQVRIMAVWL